MKLFFIEASTGCTCCADENFRRGPYTEANKDEALATIARWSKGDCNPLASQYSRFGHYSLIETEGEEIPGGRFIVDERVWGPEIEDKRDRW